MIISNLLFHCVCKNKLRTRLTMKPPVLGRCVLLALCFLHCEVTLSASESVHSSDDVVLLNPPEEPVSGYPLRVLYSCSGPTEVHLEALVSSETHNVVRVFRRRWRCDPGPPHVRALSLDLPDWLVYRSDWRIRRSDWVLSVLLRAWVTGERRSGGYRQSAARALVQLQPLDPFSRPLKDHPLCPSWDVDLLWRIHRDTIPQCPAEEEVSHLLSFVYASTGERFGIVRTLNHYGNKVLEHLRRRSISFPWCVFSTWVFMTRPCRQHFCGLVHHVDDNNNYASPVLFITDAGQIHIQMHGASGQAGAFLSRFRVPQFQWCRIDLELRGQMANITMVCEKEQQQTVQSTAYMFREAFVLDDTVGRFILGGGQFVRGIEGFYGPSAYYRNRLLSVGEVVGLPEPISSVDLTGWYKSCQQFKVDLLEKMTGYSVRNPESCGDIYSSWVSEDWTANAVPQCFHWEAPLPPQRRSAARIAEILTTRNGGRQAELGFVGRALYSLALRRLTRKDGILRGKTVMPLLHQAGCLGDNRALFLSSVLHRTGLGIRTQPDRAVLLSLLAAQQDWRLALLHLGHLHHLGGPGIPADQPLAYAYYANMAVQTSADRQNPSPGQVFVESVLLNNEDALKEQTHENDDLFLWLKFQARNGAVDAQQTVGRMLFWGQQGVSPNMQAAVKYYERGATKHEDPVSMYDYAIVLLKGQGVEQDIPKAVVFLKKAAKQNFVPAINALGWYYEKYEQDYRRAVDQWEQADAMGSSEAAFNLGIMYSQGLYPGKPVDQYKAYTYYLKSAQNGHIDGAIQLAEVWMNGIPGRVSQQPLDAVRWTKWASEQNGYLGGVLRRALEAYLRQDWSAALIYYLTAAEAGFTVAQFNVGYLCEHNFGGLLRPSFMSECMWRYYNLSTQSQNPVPYALIKMGDLVYGGHKLRKRDLSTAAELYKRAALQNDPQGWYNLGLLVQEGMELPGPLLSELGLPETPRNDNYTVLTSLYRRCRDHQEKDSYLPCSLALLNVHLQLLWKLYSATLTVFHREMLISHIKHELITSSSQG
ncbi:protein sel-1 homolog 3 isoform X2 [Amia ocellicauda]|uniref:protein sel-1 homolog 3 isoform X2 n=1 Tax=Amia ocellicauda TaxID=2972642 RepID=UPI003463F892